MEGVPRPRGGGALASILNYSRLQWCFEEASTKVKSLIRWTRRLMAAALLVGTLWLAGCVCGLVLLKWVDPPTTALQTQRRVEALLRHRKYVKRAQFVPLARIPRDFQHAVLAAEDTRFYQHHGIDWEELRKVVDQSVEEGEAVRGASTVTQQLVKNLFLTTHGSYLRKGAEFVLAPAAEFILGKRRILELYLNVAEWGPGVYGAEAAARYHFGIPAAAVGREQAARLAAILPAPRTRKPARMNGYSAEILARMERIGW